MRYEELFAAGSLVDLDVRYWRGSKKLVADDLCLSLGPAGEKVFSLGRKRLIPKEKTIGFQRIEHSARKAVDEASLPFPLAGARFVPVEKVQEIDAGLQALRSEFDEMTRQFAFEYPEVRASVRPTLIEAADEVWESIAKNGADGTDRESFERAFLARIESAYPDPRELSRRYSFRWRFYAISAPRNGTLVPETAIEATERARVRDEIRRRAVSSEEREVREAISGMADDLRKQLLGPIGFVLDRVQKGEKVTERTLNALRRACDRVKGLNFLGDEALDRALKDLGNSLVGVSAKEIRDTDAVRSQVQTAFSGIAAEIKTLADADVESMEESLKLGRRRFRM